MFIKRIINKFIRFRRNQRKRKANELELLRREWNEMLDASIRDYVKRYVRGNVSLCNGKVITRRQLNELKHKVIDYDFCGV